MTTAADCLVEALSSRAVHQMTLAPGASGAGEARRAVVNHVRPAQHASLVDLSPATMADGSALAMLCAGMVCLSAVGLLLFFHVERTASQGIVAAE
jgi:uncharacterized membrane protein (DUF2068 family)